MDHVITSSFWAKYNNFFKVDEWLPWIIIINGSIEWSKFDPNLRPGFGLVIIIIIPYKGCTNKNYLAEL